MAQVENRDEREEEIHSILWDGWLSWSGGKKRRPEKLTPEQLGRRIEEYIKDPAAELWTDGFQSVSNEFDLNDALKTGLMVGFGVGLANWLRGLARRWMARVEDYQDDYEAWQEEVSFPDRRAIRDMLNGRPSEIPSVEIPSGTRWLPWDHVRGEGVPVRTFNRDGDLVVEPPRTLVMPYDARREAVDFVTDFNTMAEMSAVRQAYQRAGVRLIGYWNTEINPCPKCAALDGQPQDVWQAVAPRGPKLHKNCRCWLTWRRIYSPSDDRFYVGI